jgi:hypothetical protein
MDSVARNDRENQIRETLVPCASQSETGTVA